MAEQEKPVVLLVIADWQTRALLHAQLEEEGYETRTSLSLGNAVLGLKQGRWPKLAAIIVDASEEHVDARLGARFEYLRSFAPIIVLTGSFGPKASELRALGANLVLSRPLTVGQVVDALKKLLSTQVPKRPAP